MCAAIILASMILHPGTVHLTLGSYMLPPLCVFKMMTGHDCPGCGLTRCFVFMGHFDPISAFQMHKLGPFLYLVVAGQLPYRLWSLFRMRGEHGYPEAGVTP